ncbi:glycoside hydrolase family 43 protein [Paenibacillus frigoriresistens]|uniref:glycoside hydrolase family 43 protein n=1 Tax=Paenibacillus alginolyticus TaxID=59839 RepID=UPI001566254F|nr:glycoside hydrolase family 43 protein [Paenibacillus frigoriresistens]NRF95960.1 glycoside hydrolase family 43 protein [Paenibacillus frigoriresistens]
MNAYYVTFRNPILDKAADPWIFKHSDGFYYFMSTQGGQLELRKSASMTGIANGQNKVIWKPEENGPYSYNLWAPEIHRLDDKWYIYFTANDGGGDDTRRVCVLENEAEDPMTGEWEWKGVIATEYPGLDGSVMTHHNQLYFMYAGYGHFPDYGSAVYIVRMTNPWTVEGENMLLTAPTLEWEKQGGMAINEGPVILKRNGKVFLVYSASTTWSEDYALGMLTMDEASDPMDPSSWEKSMVPVFRKSVENGVFATGHNSFTVSPDGTEDWIVYHALSAPNEATSLRSTRVQKFSWRSDGTPDFGIPIGTTEDITVPSGE